jgi:hypothetical protein
VNGYQATSSIPIEAGSKKRREKRVRLNYQDTKVSDLHKYVGSKYQTIPAFPQVHKRRRKASIFT